MLTRVTFQFPDGSESRYLQRVPSLDEAVTGQGRTWVVVDVETDTVGGHVVTLGSKRQSRPVGPGPTGVERKPRD